MIKSDNYRDVESLWNNGRRSWIPLASHPAKASRHPVQQKKRLQ